MSGSVAAGGSEAPPGRPLHRVLITASVMAASIMQMLDMTIATIALPHMQGSLAGTQDQMVWVLTSYIVAVAITIPLSGWLAVRIGRKRVFLASVIGFTVVSALCGMADSLTEIVVFRALQGVCGAGLVPLSQAILLDINPPEHHARAMAVWGMGTVLGPIAGPMLGGWLTDDYNWRWVFYINIPIGIAATLGILATLPETQPKRSPFDLFGFAMLSIGVGALQLMLDRGQLKDWFSSTEICIEALVAVLALYLFITHTLTAEQPFIGRAIFRDRNFVIGIVFIAIFGAVVFATLALLPPLLQGLMGFPALTAGVVTAPSGVGMAVAMLFVGRLIGRIDVRWIIVAGFSVVAFSVARMATLSPQIDAQPIVLAYFIQGLGCGLTYVTLVTIAFATLPAALRNEGTSFFNLMRNIGSSIGISATQAYVIYGTSHAHARLTEHITPYDAAALEPQLGSMMHSTSGLMLLDAQVTAQAGWIAYLDTFYVMMIAMLLVLPLILFVRIRKGSAGAHPVAME